MNNTLFYILYIFTFLPIQPQSSSVESYHTPIATSFIDIHQPEAVCISNLHIELLAVTGTFILNAYDIESGQSQDDLTAYRGLKFSFSENVLDIKRIFDCNDVGKKSIELWVTDEAGNQSRCSTTIIITDPNDTCGLTVRTSTMS